MLLKLSSLLFLASVAADLSRDAKLREFADLATHINSVQSVWTATDDFEMTAEVHRLFTQASCNHAKTKNIKSIKYTKEELDKLPKQYDVREKWGEKCPSTKKIMDQSACGSCWAFGSVEAMTDRICIHSDGKNQSALSEAHLTACASYGCGGGQLFEAYSFYQEEGIVTGGEYNSGEGCWPYPFKKCEHHTNGTRYPPCPSETYPTPECVSKCQENYTTPFKQDKHYGQKSYGFENSEDIQADIFKNGPVTTGFIVYSDFFLYKKGVYKQVSGIQVGGHAVRIFGWGEEDGVKYWLVANSWNEDWGDNGIFKILRGTDECGIESQAIASLPDFSR